MTAPRPTVRCPNCQGVVGVSAGTSGAVRCPHCQHPFQLAEPAVALPPARPAPAVARAAPVAPRPIAPAPAPARAVGSTPQPVAPVPTAAASTTQRVYERQRSQNPLPIVVGIIAVVFFVFGGIGVIWWVSESAESDSSATANSRVRRPKTETTIVPAAGSGKTRAGGPANSASKQTAPRGLRPPAKETPLGTVVGVSSADKVEGFALPAAEGSTYVVVTLRATSPVNDVDVKFSRCYLKPLEGKSCKLTSLLEAPGSTLKDEKYSVAASADAPAETKLVFQVPADRKQFELVFVPKNYGSITVGQ